MEGSALGLSQQRIVVPANHTCGSVYSEYPSFIEFGLQSKCLANTLVTFFFYYGCFILYTQVGVQKDRGLLSWPASLVRWSMHPLLTLYRVLLNNLLHVHIMPYGYRRICTKDGSAVLHVGVIDVLTRYTLRKVNDT